MGISKYMGKCSYVAKIIKTLDFSSALTKNIWFYFIISLIKDPCLTHALMPVGRPSQRYSLSFRC